MLLTAAIIIAALGSGLIAGLFFAFSTFVMQALALRPPAEGMAAMVSINRVILRSLFMPVFFGTAILGIALAIYALIVPMPASPWLIAAALVYLLANIVVTMVWNVPLNTAIDRADPAADNSALWAHYVDRWTRWNHVRTIACLAAAGLFIVALID
ncbi:DUF1772 domain-containing protein [Sphingomonas gilva]|uniref:DUF1772 domain-containing protein n=1 Tax=Sphingomonas gilva TaxID=2305907 RepID=A0A396RNP4_9SPHN|nr:anthrone oxygenase family protein [Sphingomonas gilva]RHW18038.1 DUF1772 domain-containing protein [Sphingomonas gilva]